MIQNMTGAGGRSSKLDSGQIAVYKTYSGDNIIKLKADVRNKNFGDGISILSFKDSIYITDIELISDITSTRNIITRDTGSDDIKIKIKANQISSETVTTWNSSLHAKIWISANKINGVLAGWCDISNFLQNVTLYTDALSIGANWSSTFNRVIYNGTTVYLTVNYGVSESSFDAL